MKVKQKLVGTARAKRESGGESLMDSPASVMSPGSSSSPLTPVTIKKEELTEEDEVRRMRRRERNKLAATKCRNKKKARTQLLIKVSSSSSSSFFIMIFMEGVPFRRARPWKCKTTTSRPRLVDSRLKRDDSWRF